jgi:hypothetical protein
MHAGQAETVDETHAHIMQPTSTTYLSMVLLMVPLLQLRWYTGVVFAEIKHK